MSRQSAIESRLSESLDPSHLQVTNDSAAHAGHAGHGDESHFTVTLVSAAFEGCSSVQRHRQVYKALEDLMKNGLHALIIKAYTPDEWPAA